MQTRAANRTAKPLAAATAAGILPLAVSLLPASHNLTAPTAPECGIHCGTERWTVKTLSDDAAPDVALSPLPTSVSDLVALAAPDLPSADSRAPAEMQAVTVNARLVGYKEEIGAKGDRDFHIVIEDPRTGETMIVEIPDPECSGVCASIAHDRITAARQAFSADVTKQPGLQFVAYDPPIDVVVTGVPFFDFHHGQTGVAKNCIEIHPVLDIAFPNGAPTALPRLSGGPPALGEGDYNCISE